MDDFQDINGGYKTALFPKTIPSNFAAPTSNWIMRQCKRERKREREREREGKRERGRERERVKEGDKQGRKKNKLI